MLRALHNNVVLNKARVAFPGVVTMLYPRDGADLLQGSVGMGFPASGAPLGSSTHLPAGVRNCPGAAGNHPGAEIRRLKAPKGEGESPPLGWPAGNGTAATRSDSSGRGGLCPLDWPLGEGGWKDGHMRKADFLPQKGRVH